MAGSDGQVVFSVELDDSAFAEGMARLQTSLVALGQSTLDAMRIGTAALSQAYASGTLWVNSLASGIKNNMSATAAVRGVVSAATAAAEQRGRSGGYTVGQNIVSGMINGANGKSGALNDALIRIVQSALEAAKRAAGITSPSRLFRDEVGQYLALGIGTGFTDTMKQKVMPAINQSIRQSAALGRNAIGSTLLSGVRQAMRSSILLPSVGDISIAALNGSAVQAQTGQTGRTAETGAISVTQNITFESTMQAPDEIARVIRRESVYGLAATRS